MADSSSHIPLNPRPTQILLVEDNPADVRLTQEALKETKVLNTMHVVSDGEEALAFLFRQGRYAEAPRNVSEEVVARVTGKVAKD